MKKNKKALGSAGLSLALLILFSPLSFAQNRQSLSLEGIVFDGEGTPLSGTINVDFNIYTSLNATAADHSESHSVAFDGGVYSVVLTPPSDLFEADELYIGVTIEGDTEMTPRLSLYAVPWAMEAEVARSLGDNAVTSTALANNAVTSGKVADSAITSAKINDSAVTAQKIADGAVTSAKVIDGALVDADINASAAIAFSKLSGVAASSHSHTFSDVTGTLGLSRGGTGADLSATGGANQFVKQSSAGGAFTVDTISDADVPNNITITSNVPTATALAANGANCSAGQYPLGVDASGAAEGCTSVSASGTFQPHFIRTRRFGLATISSIAATVFSFTNMSGAGCAGQGATAQPALTGASRFFLQNTSGAVSGNCAGLSTGQQTRELYRPILSTIILTDTALTNRRIWVGMATGGNTNLPGLTPSIGSSSVAFNYVGVAYDSAVDSSWLCCAGNATNQSCTDMAVDPATSTEYTITADWSTSGTITCTVNNTSISHSSFVPTATLDFGYTVTSTTTAAATVNMNMAKIMLEQN